MTTDRERETAASTTGFAVPRDDRLGPRAGLADHGPLDDARFAPGHIFASRYRIVSLLGRGAMGEVYRADDLKLGQPVAIKLLAVSGARGGKRVQRFITEVRLARTITHPNVCRVHDIGEADGWWYVSMELVDGETLESLLRRIGRLPSEKALDIARQLCAGLAAAHDRGVLHRDLKPSNIMVDGRGRIRLMDFGLALPSGEWTRGEIAGTPAYMAPEQVKGDKVTERADVYALGVVLYELYAGRRLFPARTFEERQSVGHSASVAPALPGIDPEIERIIHACLEDDPERRPASALAIAVRLPGGDPLAAAVARGVVPSPEMVAAAGPKGALRPVQAWVIFAALVISILAVASLAHVANVTPSNIPKPPDVLAERARNILAGIGANDIETDSAYWFDVTGARPAVSLPSPTANRTSESSERAKVIFVFRRSPAYLVPQNVFHVVTAVDPPANIPDMATVTLDPLGRLRGFTRLLPSSPTSQATSAPATDWATIFREAGLDMSAFVRVEPDHAPLVPYDSRLAWRQSSGTTDLRVAAATLNMHPVQFGVGTSGADDVIESRPPLSGGSAAVDLAIWLLILSVFTGSAVLARYNLRLGQGDRRGARRLGMFVVGGGALSVILRPHHVPIPLDEITYLFAATGWALAWGGLTWLVYIGLEPYLRRLWPSTLISWNRLLSGRVRDPLVGRDVLIGMLAGVIRLLLVLVPINESAASSYSAATLESLQGVPQFLNVVLPFQIGYTLAAGLAGAFVLLVLRLVVGKTWIAVGLTILVAIPLSGVSLGWMLIFVLAAPLVTLIVFLRVGLLAYIATFYVDVLLRVPMTLDPNAWFFGHSLVVLLILGALASYAFVVSLGGRRAFGASPA